MLATIEEARLVTLPGPGDVGKTRLATAVASPAPGPAATAAGTITTAGPG